MKLSTPRVSLTALLLAAPIAAQGGYSYTFHAGPTQRDFFGQAAVIVDDLDGDGIHDYVIGADGSRAGAVLDAGSVYVYSGSTDALLYRIDGAVYKGQFGHSVADAGDINGDGFTDLLLSAPSEDPNGILNAGSVYLYSGVDGSLLYRVDGTAEYVGLGNKVSSAGDVNADGVPDLLVGARYEDNGALENAGAAYVFSGVDGSELYVFRGSNSHAHLGEDLAPFGDWDGDGYDDFLLAAPLADLGTFDRAGSVYLRSGFDGSLLAKRDGSSRAHFFGTSIATIGDMNGDGLPEVIVGAPSVQVDGVRSAGRARVYSSFHGEILFEYTGTEWWQELGRSVGGGGDVNGDGYPDFFIRIPGLEFPTYRAAILRVFSGLDGKEIYRFFGTSQPGYLEDGFGLEPSSIGDLNADGFDDVLIGAPLMNGPGMTYAGGAHVYRMHPFLTSSGNTLSAATGGSISFDIDFQDAQSGNEYLLLASGTGNDYKPFRGTVLFLEQDSIFQSIALGWTPPGLIGSAGVLDANGDASAILTLGPFPSSAIGEQFWFAVVNFFPGTRVVDKGSATVTMWIEP